MDTPTPTRRALVLDWLRTHPGQHRPTAVAKGIGATSSDTANALKALTAQGLVTRHRDPSVPNGPGASTYSHTG